MEVTKQGRLKNRLAVLFVLKTSPTRLSEQQITQVSCDLNLMEMIDVKLTITELAENGLADVRESINGNFYSISKTGENTMEFYEKELNWSTREKIREYMKKNGSELELEARLFAEYFRITDNKYRVNMRIMDEEVTMFEVTLLASSKMEAAKMAEGWKRNAMKVYAATCDAIFAGDGE